jgi:NADH:ubiquinone oxidoreductase subunit F (NADH-binding)
MEDLELMDSVAQQMTGLCLCALGESVPPALRASLKYFREEYVEHITTGTCGIAPTPVAAGGSA